MVKVDFAKSFKKKVSKLNQSYRDKIEKQVKKIGENPEIGKPMKYEKKETRELYIKPFRLSYNLNLTQNISYYV